MPDVTTPEAKQMGLGKLSDWANVCACAVMFFLFYQAQQNAFEMYRTDKIDAREAARVQWAALNELKIQHERDDSKKLEILRQMQVNMDRMQTNMDELTRINAGLLAELKRIKGTHGSSE